MLLPSDQLSFYYTEIAENDVYIQTWIIIGQSCFLIDFY